MVELVAELLTSATRDERASIVYLLQARLRPDYEAIEIAATDATTQREIIEMYKQQRKT